MTCECDAVMTS